MSPSPVLVAYDGRCPSTLQVGAALARALGLGVTFVTAYQYDPVAFGARVLPSPATERRFGRAQAIAEGAAAGLDELAVETVVLPATDVRSALADLAVELDATVVVVGPDLHGDVARSLMSGAACPVVVAPEDPRLLSGSFKEIGVAYDGSPGSRFALTAATDLAIRCDGRVHVITVAPDPYHALDLERVAERAVAGVDAVPVEVDMRYGETSRMLRDAARHLDLIAAGTHGRGPIGRGLFGSVSAELVRLPSCAVMVVPPHVRRRSGTPLGLATAAST